MAFKLRCHLKSHLIAIYKNGPSQLSEYGAGNMTRSYNPILYSIIFPSLLTGPQDRPVMQFKCNQCGRSYKYQKCLSYHLRNECGKNSTYFCTKSKCEYQTKHKNNFQSHPINVHDIKRPQLALFGPGNYFIYYPFNCLNFFFLQMLTWDALYQYIFFYSFRTKLHCSFYIAVLLKLIK